MRHHPGAAMDPDPRERIGARFPRVALSHDWTVVPGGSEKVVEAILELLPHAELFTSVYDPARFGETITARRVHTSFLDRIPGARTHYPKLLPLMNRAFRAFDLGDVDLVVSSNHSSAKNVRTPEGVPHVCYCHAPMRYAWDPTFLEGERLGLVGGAVFRAALPLLRRNDLRGAREPTRFVANSTFVAERIKSIYEHDADVVHPPVDVDRFLTQPRVADDDAPYLFFGRVVPYKRADLAVAAAMRLGRRLVVAGSGRDLDRVRSLAGPGIEFLGHVSDAQAAELFASSRALLFPGIEDFGIVPVEAQAAGLPVIGLGRGGLRDTVVDGETGVLYDDAGALADAIERFESLTLDEAAIRGNATRFAPARFAAAFSQLLLDAA